MSIILFWVLICWSIYQVFLQHFLGLQGMLRIRLRPQFYFDLLQTLLNRAFTFLEWGLNSPPKPHGSTSLPLHSGSIDIASLITSFPPDIKDLILGHLGANHSDIKNQTDTVLCGLSQLDMSHNISTQMFPQDDSLQTRHMGIYSSVSKEISKLIHMKGFYEPITKDYSHVNSCIESLNHGFIYKRNTDEIHSIKDLITNLKSYKI